MSAPTKILLNPVGGAGIPTFVLVRNIPNTNLSEDCWVFLYSKLTNRVYGSSQIINTEGVWSAPLVGKSEDYTEEGDEGFDHLEEISVGIYYPDGTYREVFGDIQNMLKNDVDEMKYMPFNVYSFDAKMIGEEITDLVYDPELAEVKLNVNIKGFFNVGDYSPVIIGVTQKNIGNLKLTLEEGQGEIISYRNSQWRDGKPYRHCYLVNSNDSVVKIRAEGVDIFTGETIEDIAIMQVNQKQWENVLYEDEHMVFYEGNGKVFVESKTSDVYLIMSRLNKDGGLIDKTHTNRLSVFVRDAKVLGTKEKLLARGGTWLFENYMVKPDKKYEATSLEGTSFTFENAEPFDEVKPELPGIEIPSDAEVLIDDDVITLFKDATGYYHAVSKVDNRVMFRGFMSKGDQTRGWAGKILEKRNFEYKFRLSKYYSNNPEYSDYYFEYYEIGKEKRIYSL